MKTLISLAVLLAVVGLAQAEHDASYLDSVKSTVGQQQLSKRPYAASVADRETFEGAVIDKEAVEQPKRLNLHMLDRRPHMEKAAD
jgi:hypothetical protein